MANGSQNPSPTVAEVQEKLCALQEEVSRLLNWSFLRFQLLRDAEKKKVLGHIHGHVGQISLLLNAPPSNRFSSEQLKALSDLLDIDKSAWGTNTEALWVHADRLMEQLPSLGNEASVRALLLKEDQRNATENADDEIKWNRYYKPQDLAELLEAFKTSPVQSIYYDLAVQQLTCVYQERSLFGRVRRARGNVRTTLLHWLSTILLILTVGLCALLYFYVNPSYVSPEQVNKSSISESWLSLLVSVFAGALGSSISGALQARDRLGHINLLRSFAATMLVQPYVGAAAGLLIYLILHQGIPGILDARTEKTPLTFSVYGFIAGYSEPFFLGLVSRIAGASDKNTEKTAKSPSS